MKMRVELDENEIKKLIVAHINKSFPRNPVRVNDVTLHITGPSQDDPLYNTGFVKASAEIETTLTKARGVGCARTVQEEG